METNGTAHNPMGVLSRIMNLFVSPSETFEALIAKPDWVTPIVISVILFLTTGILLKDVIQAEQVKATREAIMKNNSIESGQKEQVIEQSTTMMKKFWFLGYGVGLIIVIGIYFLAALFLRMGGNMMGGSAGYMPVLSIFAYSTLIDAAASLVKVPLMVVNQTMRVDTGLGLFAAEDAMRTPLYAFLSKFDIFTFWQLAVLIIGLSMLYKFSKGKTAGLVLGLWLVWVLISVGFAVIGKGMGG
jgi:hypothetical protein